MSKWEQDKREALRDPVVRFWYWVAGLAFRWQQIKDGWDIMRGRWPYSVDLGYHQALQGWEHLTTLKATIETTNTGFSAYFEQVPGVAATGATRDEVTTNLREALKLHRESYHVNPQFPTIWYIDAAFADMVSV